MNRRDRNSSGHRRFKTASFVRSTIAEAFIVLGCILLVLQIPNVAAFINKNGADTVEALEMTVAIYKSPAGSGSVYVSDTLIAFAKTQGVSEENLRDFLAAALSVGIRPEHMMGFAGVESGYCRNIGSGVAIDEVRKRLYSSPPEERQWWMKNVDALNKIAKDLTINVRSIPGSIGAGAISCFQIMPVNWVNLGGGDYRNPKTAAINAARYIKRSKYDQNPENAILAYNRRGGQQYVNLVKDKAEKWKPYLQDVSLVSEEPGKLRIWWELPAIYLENLSRAMKSETPLVADYGNTGETPSVVGKYVFPLPGGYSSRGYGWLSPVYGWVNGKKVFLIKHPGIDWITRQGDKVVAAHNGEVLYANYLSQRTNLAGKLWSSGYVVIIRGTTSEGSSVCTIYAHGKEGSIAVKKGQIVQAGEIIMRVGNTGFSDTPHLHFGLKFDAKGKYCEIGQFSNPSILFR